MPMHDNQLRGVKLRRKRNLLRDLDIVNAEIEVIEKRMEKAAEEENYKHIEELKEKHEETDVDKGVDRLYEEEERDPAGDDEI